MRRTLLVVAGFAWIVGCAATRQEEPAPQPAAPPAAAARAPAAHVARIQVDPSLPADALGPVLARHAGELGLPRAVAFIWGDASEPPGARRVAIEAGGARIEGWLVGGAQQVDMGKLADGIDNVVMVKCDKTQLLAGHPSGPGRIPLDFPEQDTDGQRESGIFAFVSLEPGDVADDATSGDVVALLSRLPSRVRYAVIGLPG
jgi:hypothetical protein